MEQHEEELTEVEKAALENEELREQVRASRERGGRNPRPRLNDLSDGENVVQLVREDRDE